MFLSSLVSATTLRCILIIIEEVKIVGKNKNKCSSCIFYILLFSVFFAINVGIATYFVYYKYMNPNKENVSKYDYVYQDKKLLII